MTGGVIAALRGGRYNNSKRSAPMKKPFVNQDECVSCGLCTDNLPAVFRLADNGKAECYNPAGASEADIQDNAIDVCPVSCISWVE
jgi:ferredoxin